MGTITLTSTSDRGPMTPVRGPDNLVPGANGDVAATAVYSAVLRFDHGAQACAAGDTISIDLAAQIGRERRSGKTVTIRSAAMCEPAYNENTGYALAWKTQSLTSPNFTFILCVNDYTTTTNSGIAAAAVLRRPYGIFVAWSEA